MARTTTPSAKTALVANTDLTARLHFQNPDDPEAVDIGDMKFHMDIGWGDGTKSTAPPIKITDALSGQALTDFRAALVTLRDAAFDAAGIPDV